MSGKRPHLQVKEMQGQFLVQNYPLEKNMATHSTSLGNPMDQEAWRAIVHGVPQSWTWLSMHTLGVVHSLGLDKYIMACIHHQSIIQSSLTALKIPWTAAHQAPPSMGFSGQQYWNGVPLPSPMEYGTSGLKFSDLNTGIMN